ncbi:HWE histidine kinase [Litoreibacter ponti]|uniref:histidine kinase n=1 Tax=Litoreibacter ponti TaxID=1510457 RepID=A0A2T6BDC3_9RHOB|nr:PAS domain-containing protein [Litoreibacter ponti]PTX54032.1 HWE histidine kinase [Litoreibacter ponti]
MSVTFPTNPMRRTLRKVEDLSHRAQLALEAGSLATFEWNLAADTCIVDATLRQLFDLPEGEVTGAMVFDRVHPDDLSALRATIAATLAPRGADFDTSFRILRAGRTVWIGGRGRVVERDDDGRPLRMIGVNWDMTRAKQEEARRLDLTREMDHRVNNSYALMEALIAMGEMEYRRAEDFAAMLQTQIHALSDAHQLASDVLLHEQKNRAALPLEDVVGRALRRVPERLRRFDLAPGLAIRVQDVAALVMLLHHLRMGMLQSAPLVLRATPQIAGWSELTWACGAPMVPVGEPDFIVALCIEQLGGRLLHNGQAKAGQMLSFTFPVFDEGAVMPDAAQIAQHAMPVAQYF